MVAPVHHTLFVCVIFMRKKSAVVKFVPKDFVVIVFLGVPMPTVRPPRPSCGSAAVGGRVNQKSDTRPPRPPIPTVRPPRPLIPTVRPPRPLTPTVRRPCKQPSDVPASGRGSRYANVNGKKTPMTDRMRELFEGRNDNFLCAQMRTF